MVLSLHRHEAQYGSSGKSPGERGDRTPTLEPTAQSGSSYWSAREEKLKASSVLGSRTKSFSQDDDDENVRSKVRSRSRSQSDWQSEESATSSERKSASKRRRRKTETSSCSGSEYSSVVRERRMSRSSSGSEDVYLASLSRQGGDVGSSLPDRELLREESSEDEPLISMADRRGSIPEATAEQREDTCEDISAVGLSSQGANVNLPASFAAYESDVRNYGSRIYESGTDCEDEIEPDDNRDRTGLAQSGYVAHAPQQEGEIQVELWQGSSHWNLSVENVVAGNRENPSLEVISVQEPVSDTEVVISDQVADSAGQFSADQEYQVFYDKPDDASEDIVKGTKRPRSPDTDGASPVCMPSKRLRSESPGSCSDESVKVAANIETTSPVVSPRESFVEDETSSSSSVEQTSPEPCAGNSPEHEQIFQEQVEERRDALTEEQLYEDKMKDEMQPATEAQTSDVMDSGSPDVVDEHRDGDREPQESIAHNLQTSDESESSVECKMSPNPQAVSTVVATTEREVKSPPPEELGAPASDESVSAEGVSPSFDPSAVADESSTPLLTPIVAEVTSLELERMSSIPQTGETSSSSHSDVVPMETTVVAEAIDGEEHVRSPGVVAMVAEEEQVTATEDTEAPAKDRMDVEDRPDGEDLATEDIVIQYPTPDNNVTQVPSHHTDEETEPKYEDSEDLATEDNVIQYSTQDIAVTEVPSHNEEIEQTSDPTRQTCSSGIPPEGAGSDSNEDHLDEEGSEQDSDKLHVSSEDALLRTSLPSMQQNIVLETVQTIASMSPNSCDVPTPNKLSLEDKPDSLLANVVADSGESAFVEKHSTVDDVEVATSLAEAGSQSELDEHVGKELPTDDVKMTESNSETEFPTTEDERVEKDLPIDDIEMTDSDLPAGEDAGKELLRDDVKMTPSITEAEPPKIEDEHVGKALSGDDVTQSSSETELPTREDEDVEKDLPTDDVKITPSTTDSNLPMREDVGSDLPRDDVKMTSSSTESDLPMKEDEHVGSDLPGDDVKMTQSNIETELPASEDVGKELSTAEVKMTQSSTETEAPTTEDKHVGKDLPRDDVKMTSTITEAEPPTNEDVGKDLLSDDVKMTQSITEAELPNAENADNDLPVDDVKMTQSSTDEHVGKELARDDAEITSSSTEAKPPSRKSEQVGEEDDKPRDEGNVNIGTSHSTRKAKHVEKPAADDSVKVSPRNVNAISVEIAKSSPQPEASDVESSFDEGASETCAKDKEGSQNKLESDEKESVPDAKKESVPDVKKDSVLDSKKDSVLDSKKDSVLDSKKESGPNSKKESVLDTKKESVPDAKKESVPDVKMDSVEDTKKESVPDAGASTRSISPRTKGVEVKAAAPMAGRRKSQRSTVEHHKVPDTREHDLRKSTESDRPQSISAPTREIRGRRAGATPPEGSTREPQRPRRAATPPPLRTRRQSGGSVEAGPSVSSTGRKPTKAVAPPAKAVTPPVVKSKVDNLHVTRSTRKKSQEASLPIAKRLRR